MSDLRMGDIGEEPYEVEFEPLTEPAHIEPIPAPVEPVKVPVPA